MEDTLKVQIIHRDTSDADLHLRELGDALTDELRIVPKEVQGPEQSGVKDPLSIIALVFAGVSATAATYSAILSTVSAWQSAQPKKRIAISRGNLTLQVDNPSEEQLDAFMIQLSESTGNITLALERNDDP